MSRPARWDMATGRLYRQAAALSGNKLPLGHCSEWSAPKGRDVEPRSGDKIRACVRIAAGASPGVHQLGKGSAKDAVPGFGIYASSLSSSPRLRPPPYRGANAPIFFHFACGGPLGHPQSGDRSSPSSPRELIGRQPFHQSLHASVEPLKTAHSSLRIGSRRPSSARTGLRDQRNVSAPRVDPEIRRSTWTKTASQRVEK